MMPDTPFFRGRRLRRTEGLRSLAGETDLSPRRLLLPLFIQEGISGRSAVASMPGVHRSSVDDALRDAEEAISLGLGGLLLFGIPAAKDAEGSGAWAEDGIVQKALRALRTEFPSLLLVTDVCLCEYTSHGHCGILDGERILNDESLGLLARTAVSHARAGADVVAPSDMMDGRVGMIRRALDREGFAEVPILSYAAKYASAFYGPFRDAADSTPAFGDRRGYQMDPANVREAMREVRADIGEGADLILVKPALPYLDVLARIRAEVTLPITAYQVSGEYSMILGAAERGWIDGPRAMTEALLSIRRAGADSIVTYWAREYARIRKAETTGGGD